eukprot:TRINITY_DN11191_c0_g1_i1.p1 TRINITY_DN11191_c0_g1~~TRINITY_DN11191_c0_g1_i1.p1  ORF type:complete len:380 (-),score=40.67 TRINITY_DN11191_c0_g1_i1:61-1200(-)
MSRTEQFKKARTAHQELESIVLDRKLDYIEGRFKSKENQANTVFGSFLRGLSLTKNLSCINCNQNLNLTTGKIRYCGHCKLPFCNSCVIERPVKMIREIFSRSTQETEFFECERCTLKYRHMYRAFEIQKTNEAKDSDSINKCYTDLMWFKSKIMQLLPRYDYLASSLGGSSTSTSSRTFEEVVGIERQLLDLFKDVQLQMKKLMMIPTSSDKRKQLVNNIKSAFSLFVEQRVPNFNATRRKIRILELDTISTCFGLLRNMWQLVESNRDVRQKYGKSIQNAISFVKDEGLQAVSSSSSNEAEWKNKFSIVDGDDKGTKNLIEPIVIRKLINLTKECIKILDHRIGLSGAPLTRRVFEALLAMLEQDRDKEINNFLNQE